jgi:hypothetical protein
MTNAPVTGLICLGLFDTRETGGLETGAELGQELHRAVAAPCGAVAERLKAAVC